VSTDATAVDATRADAPEVDATPADAPVADAPAVDATPADAPAVDAIPDGAQVACEPPIASFAYTNAGQQQYRRAVVDTGIGWIIAYDTTPTTRQVWWTAVAYDGTVLAAPQSLPGMRFEPRLAVEGTTVWLASVMEGGSWFVQPLTVAGAIDGAERSLPSSGAQLGGLIGEPGQGFRAVWYRTRPVSYPERPHEIDVTVAHLDHNGVPTGTATTTLVNATPVGPATGFADGTAALATNVLSPVGICFACGTTGVAVIAAGDGVTDHGSTPVSASQRGIELGFTEAGAQRYSYWTGYPQTMGGTQDGFIARLPHTPLVTIARAGGLSIAGTRAGAGAIVYFDVDGGWVQAFTDDGTHFARGERCRLDLRPNMTLRRDDTSVLVLNDDGGGRIVRIP